MLVVLAPGVSIVEPEIENENTIVIIVCVNAMPQTDFIILIYINIYIYAYIYVKCVDVDVESRNLWNASTHSIAQKHKHFRRCFGLESRQTLNGLNFVPLWFTT